ncbi:hypothetical protein E2I00_012994 [Balaenoptera physalus]|uniref:Uncharacterized protein n=1 Tax=Balaenoptera physalus TaxID=9770 RepID=A0A6A1Q770_BALPH|nr:hypothetical protein E2I00_012994 [Balaenoptera physalus]
MPPARKDGERGCSAITEEVTRESTVNIHEQTHGVGFKKRAPQALKEIQKSAKKETGTPDVHSDNSFNKAVSAKGLRNVPYCIHLWLCGCPENIKLKIHQTSSIRWLPKYLSPL